MQFSCYNDIITIKSNSRMSRKTILKHNIENVRSYREDKIMNCRLLKKLLSLLLSLVMLTGMLSLPVYAEETKTTEHEHVWNEGVLISPGCDAGGYTEYTCTDCGEGKMDSLMPALGHSWGEWSVVSEATAEAEGLQKRVCTVCAETETRTETLSVFSVAVSQAERITQLAAGKKLQLTASVRPENTSDQIALWSSSDESVATVDDDGMVTGISQGEVTIFAAFGSAEGSYVLTVTEADVSETVPVQSIVVSQVQGYRDVLVSDTLVLTASVLPEDATDRTVVWKSSDETIAAVDSNGMVTGIAEGEATITAACSKIVGAYTLTVIMPDNTALVAETDTSGSCGDAAFWEYDVTTATLTISGEGPIADFEYSSEVPWYNYRSQIASIKIQSGITAIGYMAFSGCTAITKVSIPDTVTQIGTNAFKDCTSLNDIYIPSSVTHIAGSSTYTSAFYGCNTGLKIFCGISSAPSTWGSYWRYCKSNTTLAVYYNCTEEDARYWSTVDKTAASIVIPDGITCIPGTAFYGCKTLQEITIPDSVTSIGYNAFENCTGLTYIYIPASVTSISASSAGSSPFYGCQNLTICCGAASKPSGWGSYWNYFSSKGSFSVQYGHSREEAPIWSALDKTSAVVEIPEGVTSIPASVFSGRKTLEEVIIPSTVLTIEASAFKGCSALRSIDIPENVAVIGEYAFHNCPALTEINIPDNGISIGKSAFANCTALTEIVLPESIGTTGANIFANCTALTSVTIPGGWTAIPYGMFNYCYGLKSVTVLDGVSEIGQSAFAGCSYLETVSLPDSITTISANAFSECSRLTEITLSDSLAVMGKSAFQNCAALTSVTIPGSLKEIPESAFLRCNSLQTVLLGDGITAIGKNAFDSCKALRKIHIPGSVATIPAYDYRQSPFQYCSSDLVIYCEAQSRPGGWGANWNYYSSSSKLTVKFGYSAMDAEFWDTLDRTASSIVIPEGIRFIPEEAFSEKTDLQEITLPSTLTVIGAGAFYGCVSLREIRLPDSLTGIGKQAFYGCSTLESVRIPDSITVLEESVFNGCSSLREINFPNTLTTIGKNAFSNCTGLKMIYIPDSVTSITGGMESVSPFFGCSADLNVYCAAPKSPSGWGNYWNAYSYDSSGRLTVGYRYTAADAEFWDSFDKSASSITIPEGVTLIPYAAFRDRTDLLEIILPDTITVIDDVAFSGCSSLTELVIPENVTDIGEAAFAYCTALTEVSFPDSVTNFEGSIFYGCTGLTKVKLPAKITEIKLNTFRSCGKLTDLTMPDTVTTIGPYAFFLCGSLKQFPVSDSLTTISENAFYGCESFTSVVLPDGLTTIGNMAFRDCDMLSFVYIPESVTVIDGTPFYGCEEILGIFCAADAALGDWYANWNDRYNQSPLNVFYNYSAADAAYWNSIDRSAERIEIPATITSIPQSAFYKCTNLKEMVIPDTVTSIGANAFRGCYGLQKVVISQGVSAIEDNTFWDCTSLTEVFLSDSVTHIGNYAFRNCASLRWLFLPASVTTISTAYENGSYEDPFSPCNRELKIYCAADSKPDGWDTGWDSRVFVIWNCTREDAAFWGTVDKNSISIVVPEGVTLVPDHALSYCSNLQEITIADSVTSIGTYAFYSCSSLKKVSLPANLREIKTYAFAHCRALTDLIIPGSTASIETDAFIYCSGLRWVYIPASVGAIAAYPFRSCYNLTLYTNAVAKPEGWNTYWNHNGSSSLTVEYGTSAVDTLFWNTLDKSASVISVPEGITYIPDSAFSGCTFLTEICIPDSVTTIGSSAFYNCTGLTKINLPDTLTSIGTKTFYNCTALKEIIIPTSIETVDTLAFAYCSKLVEITFEGDAPSFAENTFFSVKAKAYYPAGNTTWSAETLLGYGGTIQWKAKCFNGHTPIIEEAVAPTCTETGLTEGKRCSVCDEVLTTQQVVPANGHREVIDEAVEPTCTATGLMEGKHCSICGKVLVTQAVISALEHNYIGGKCEFCDRLEPIKGDLNDDGMITDQDAVELLWCTLYPELRPDGFHTDFNGDGNTDIEDAVYLIWYTLFPSLYPIR